MKLFLLPFLFLLVSVELVNCQTETFEDETDNTTSFTETVSGGTFNTTSNFEIQIGGAFGAGGSNGWLDSQAGNPVTGVVGQIQVSGLTTSFILTQLEAWTSANNASSEASGMVTFRGTPLGGGGPLVEAIFINPPDIATYDVVTFSGALSGVALTALEVDLTGSGLNYIGLDNLVFASIMVPVELISFDAKVNAAKNAQLSWTIASELNNEKFRVEKSENGKDFFPIGEVAGNGTTNKTHQYSFVDTKASEGINYYRLQQIDFDGKSDYSKIISLDLGGNKNGIGRLYPNPASPGLVYLDYANINDEKINLSVYDAKGVLILNHVEPASDIGSNPSFDFSLLRSGVYIVQITQDNRIAHRKLIIE